MENTKEILDDISSMYNDYDELEKRMRTKLTEYCEVLNEKYKDRIGEKITTVETEYHDYYGGFTFFGGFKIDYIGHLVIVPILFYPTKKGVVSTRRAVVVSSYTDMVIKELDGKI